MVGNVAGSDIRRRGCCEEWILAFLLWGPHAKGMEGESLCQTGTRGSRSDGGDFFQVPTERVDHPNGVAEVADLTVLIPPKDLDVFERQLTSVIGFKPEVGPNDTRTWSLSTTTGSDYPHLILRTPKGGEEERYVRERKGCIYKVAFKSTRVDGGLLSI